MLRKFISNVKGSAVGFVLGVFILILIVVNLVVPLTEQAWDAQNDTTVANYAGAVAMIGILVLIFIVLPLLVVSKIVN